MKIEQAIVGILILVPVVSYGGLAAVTLLS